MAATLCRSTCAQDNICVRHKRCTRGKTCLGNMITPTVLPLRERVLVCRTFTHCNSCLFIYDPLIHVDDTTQDADGELDENDWLAKQPQTKSFMVYSYPLTLRFNHCLLQREIGSGMFPYPDDEPTHEFGSFRSPTCAGRPAFTRAINSTIWNQWTFLLRWGTFDPVVYAEMWWNIATSRPNINHARTPFCFARNNLVPRA